MMDEIRLHGRGGQGVVAASELIALAACYEGKFCRAFPMYGGARRGAPVVAFVQIGEESEATRCMIYHPKYLIVLDPSIPKSEDVASGFIDGGVITYNTTMPPDQAAMFFKAKISKIAVLDATQLAEGILGQAIPNTVMLGAFTRATGLLKIKAVERAIDKVFTTRLAAINKEAAIMGFQAVRIKSF
jgi:2-oxoacid:acceptor oxidoreductase gamma subunit (pyruvate/2-ketoisovalerate family)